MPPVPTRGARAKPTRKTDARPRSENGADGLTQTQLNRLLTALEAAAEGDFSVRLRADGPLAGVAAAFNTLVESNAQRQCGVVPLATKQPLSRNCSRQTRGPRRDHHRSANRRFAAKNARSGTIGPQPTSVKHCAQRVNPRRRPRCTRSASITG